MKVGEKDRDAGQSSKEGDPPRGEKITGAQKAATTLAEKDEVVKKSIEEKEQAKKSTPPPPSMTSEPELAASSAKRPAEETPGARKKTKKSTSKPTKQGKDYEGDRVAKDFDGEIYFGIVGDVWRDSDEEVDLWRITYDDNDAEDMDKKELLKALKLYEKEKAKDPKLK